MNTSMTNPSTEPALTESERIARFAVQLQASDIPPDVKELAKEHLLDTLGIAIASSGFDFGPVILKGVRALGEGGPATGIGSGVSLPASSAALLNGVLAHGLDYDDTHIAGIYHASAPALAASMLCCAISSGVQGRCGDMLGVWTAPVMAQLMIVFVMDLPR